MPCLCYIKCTFYVFVDTLEALRRRTDACNVCCKSVDVTVIILQAGRQAPAGANSHIYLQDEEGSTQLHRDQRKQHTVRVDHLLVRKLLTAVDSGRLFTLGGKKKKKGKKNLISQKMRYWLSIWFLWKYHENNLISHNYGLTSNFCAIVCNVWDLVCEYHNLVSHNNISISHYYDLVPHDNNLVA